MTSEYIVGWANASNYCGPSAPTLRRDPDFPEPTRLSTRRVGWKRSVLDAYMAKKPKGVLHQSEDHKQKAAAGRAAKRKELHPNKV